MTQQNQKTILERIASGDQSAVKDCIGSYGDLIWSLARRFLRNDADAEDVVQDIFIDLWGSAARFDRNVQPYHYWSGTEYAPDSSNA